MKKLIVSIAIALASGAVFTGCQNMSASQSMSSDQNMRTTQSAPKAQVSNSRSQPVRSDSSMVPPEARVGECYARVMLPPVYRTITEQVVDREASQRIEITPAEFEQVTQRVMVKEASENWEIVPATYKTVTERVMVSPASERLIKVPAEYRTVSESMLVRPAYTEWKKGADPLQELNGATGEIMCLVTVPAEYKTVEKQVLVSAATTRIEKIPATYETVSKEVIATPPTTRKTVVPAVYDTVSVTKLKTAEQKRVVPIPAQFHTVEKTVISEQSRTGWQRILCETNVTPAVIADLQQRLVAAGHTISSVDGILNAETFSAITAYQQANQLSTGGLTYELFEEIGVNI